MLQSSAVIRCCELVVANLTFQNAQVIADKTNLATAAQALEEHGACLLGATQQTQGIAQVNLRAAVFGVKRQRALVMRQRRL
jgi:hypothetical protein